MIRFPSPLPAALLLATLPAGLVAQETYRHATGFTFRYPAGWQVQETQGGIALVPSDAARDATGQPLEVFVIASQPAQGIARPDDPRVVAFFEQNLAPFQRVGSVESLASGLGPGSVLTFQGQTGPVPVRHRVYVTLHGGEGIYLLHTARQDIAARRDVQARALFDSFAWETRSGAASGPAGPAPAGSLDTRLVRTWRRSSTSGSSDVYGSAYATDQETVAFAADGTVVYAVGTTVSAGTSGTSAYSEGDPNARRGRWSVAGNVLTVQWDDGGADRFEYSVFIHTDGLPALKIVVPGEGPRFYR